MTATKAKRHEKYKKIGKRQEEVVQVIFEKAGMPTHVNVEEAKKGNVKELLKLGPARPTQEASTAGGASAPRPGRTGGPAACCGSRCRSRGAARGRPGRRAPAGAA